LVVGDSQAAGRLTISSGYTDPDDKLVSITTAVVVVIDSSTKSIKDKFSVVTKGTDAVKDTFTALHLFIQNGGLNKQSEVIQLGDWIDMEGGLEIGSYFGGEFSSSDDPDWNKEITVQRAEQSVEKLSRLIVVGINSFHTGRGKKKDNNTPTYNGDGDGEYTYPKAEGEGNPPSHVVFQFQNLLAVHGMNSTGASFDGYPISLMRKYLVKVGDDPKEGKFLAGLLGAGVPEGVLWAPSRMVSARTSYSSSAGSPAGIRDKVWLPTEWEMLGKRSQALQDDETKSNQAWLEYYTSDASRKKFDASQTAKPYWLASQVTNNNYAFCCVGNAGQTYSSGSDGGSSNMYGVAPAFCVY
jgi:hypothetical protein